jgi:hypothetical protein
VGREIVCPFCGERALLVDPPERFGLRGADGVRWDMCLRCGATVSPSAFQGWGPVVSLADVKAVLRSYVNDPAGEEPEFRKNMVTGPGAPLELLWAKRRLRAPGGGSDG